MGSNDSTIMNIPPSTIDKDAETCQIDSFADVSVLRHPLPEIMRPKSLPQYIGQDHLLNKHNGRITNFINLNYLPSMILHGPPGVGKTTLASILAAHVGYVFVELSATDGSIDDLKELLTVISQENAIRAQRNEVLLPVVVFIDEIHRFRINQQDYLLPIIESGLFVFIGATTYDPYKRLRKAILSRCQVFELHKLEHSELVAILKKAILHENIRRRRLYNKNFISYPSESIEFLVARSKGDSRKLIGFVEFISLNYMGDEFNYDGTFRPVDVKYDLLIKIIELVDRNDDTNTTNELYRQLFDVIRRPIDWPRKKVHQDPSKQVKKRKRDINGHNEKEGSRDIQDKSNLKRQTINNTNDHFFDNDSPRYIRRSDSPTEFDQAAQMQYSDNEYEPLGILSDTELDYEMITPSDRIRYQVTIAISILLRIIALNEPPVEVVKKLFMFSLIYVEDNSHLEKFKALIKSLNSVKLNTIKLLSLMVERLVKVKKTTPITSRLKLMKYFFNLKYKESFKQLIIPEVEYDEDTLNQLLTRPVPEEYKGFDGIDISVFDVDDGDINVGVAPTGMNLDTSFMADMIDQPEPRNRQTKASNSIPKSASAPESSSDSDLTPVLSFSLNHLQDYDSQLVLWSEQ